MRGPSGPFADPWAPDVTVPRWMPLSDGAGTAPDGRFLGAMAWDEVTDRLLRFGGRDAADLGNRNDLWGFDPDAGVWSERVVSDVGARPALGFCDLLFSETKYECVSMCL